MKKYRIEYFEELESTNEYAKNCSQDRTVIIANSQTKGKGRLGRSWSNNPGEAVTMSIFLKPDIEPETASMLTIVLAMAIKKTIDIDTMIKWPNDVVCNGKKIAGILTEMSVQGREINYVIAGIGINVNVQKFDEDISDKATSLFLETGRKYDIKTIVDRVLECFDEYYEVFLKDRDLKGIKTEYNKFLANKDKEVQIISQQEDIKGIARGINDSGELLVELLDGSVYTVRSGEVSVRGIYGYV